jgi:hypothetical protein
MAKASRTGHRPPAQVSHVASKAASATVASLGVQARLVRVDPDRERAFARLLEQYEGICQEWDHLARQAINLLGPEFQPHPPGDEPLPHNGNG